MIKTWSLVTCLLLVVIFSGFKAMAQIAVSTSPNLSAQQLAELLVGHGVIVSNASFSSGHAHQSVGVFSNGGAANMGLESGIVLSSGFVTDINNPANVLASTILHDQDIGNLFLEELIEPAYKTLDAVMLEFDVRVAADTLQFQYVFGSEEYPVYSCSQFNDVFGFFISGPGIEGNLASLPGIRNIALLPDGVTPVSINTIHAETPQCEAANEQYFVDNISGTTVVYNGFTTVLTAAVYGLVPDQTYRLRLAIADVEDKVLDSGVFIKRGSLSSFGQGVVKVNAGSDTLICAGAGAIRLEATVQTDLPEVTYLWQPGESVSAPTQPVTYVSPKVTTNYVLTVRAGGFTFYDTLKVIVNPPLELAISAFPPGGSLPLQVSFSATGNNLVSYYWDFGDPASASDTSTVSHPEYLYQQSGLFRPVLVARDIAGCTDSVAYSFIRASHFIPNIITPNGDGINDVFDIGVMPAQTLLQVFNRWGDKVFEKGSYDNTWGGRELPGGVYFYYVRYPGNNEAYRGWLEIHK